VVTPDEVDSGRREVGDALLEHKLAGAVVDPHDPVQPKRDGAANDRQTNRGLVAVVGFCRTVP
jgi:hypothetical protein